MEEREEGELSDCELSDISSEEEYLLRQRLHILETYNHALQRKSARRKISESSRCHRDTENKRHESLLPHLSDISDCDLENCVNLNIPKKKHKIKKKKCLDYTVKPSIRQKSSKNEYRYEKLTSGTRQCTKTESKKYATSSSDETDEYRNKRRKLQHSVEINTHKSDVTSLKARLLNMFHPKIYEKTEESFNSTEIDKSVPLLGNVPNTNEEIKSVCKKGLQSEINNHCILNDHGDSVHYDLPPMPTTLHENIDKPYHKIECVDLEDLIENRDAKPETENNTQQDDKKEDSKNIVLPQHDVDLDSDDDIEILRQNALQTKTIKKTPSHEVAHNSDSDDSEELRMICLKSKVLKNQLEYKRKIRMRKKLQRMSNFDDLEMKLKELSDEEATTGIIDDNTDNESVDMEIGVSDGTGGDDDGLHENKHASEAKECSHNVVTPGKGKELKTNVEALSVGKDFVNSPKPLINDTLEEDEDLLRAKLLTSLSNNLQKLYKTENQSHADKKPQAKPIDQISVEPKRIVITVGGSDSESEDETKNTTETCDVKNTVDFKNSLDILLRNARRQMEFKEISKVLSTANYTTSPEKFVPKKVSHLPISEQLEYKRLVKRMSELEKLKQNRQINFSESKNATPGKSVVNSKVNVEQKDSDLINLPNKDVSWNSDLESQIALSRKRIAMESAKVLHLKEESTKLIQKYKMAQAELRNVRTAMALNKRHTLRLKASLANMTAQHQMLIKSTRDSSNVMYTNYGKTTRTIEKKPKVPATCFTVTEINDKSKLQSVKVSVLNDFKTYACRKTPNKVINKNLDVSLNDKKVVTLSKNKSRSKMENKSGHRTTSPTQPSVKPEQGLHQKTNASYIHSNKSKHILETKRLEADSVPDDYTSPLASLTSDVKWRDPHGILCPFEVQGSCKDAACSYQHSAEARP